jgi:hypothetical protein
LPRKINQQRVEMDIVEAYRRLRGAQDNYNRACNPPNQDAIRIAEDALRHAQEDLDTAVNAAWTSNGIPAMAITK